MTEQRPNGGSANDAVRVEQPLRIRERFFNDGVTDAAEHYGWRTFHLRDRDSIHIVRGRGFPDLVMFRKNPITGDIELLAAELKRDYDSTTFPEQEEWLEALCSRMPTYVWRPDDWPDIEKILDEGTAEYPSTWRPASTSSRSPIPRNFGPVIGNIIEAIEATEMTTGDKAGLRRMDPASPDCTAFWKLMSKRGMPIDPDVKKWGLIMHGIALMAHTAGQAHNSRVHVGTALYSGRERQRSQALYSEDRLNRLLAARGSTLHRILTHLFRMLASQRCAFDWREMSWYILNEGCDESEAEESRRKIARAYYIEAGRNENRDDS